MSQQLYHKNQVWVNYGIVVVISLVLIVMDTKTNWLSMPRNGLSVVLRPVQAIATVPASVGNFFSTLMENEPDSSIAYENLSNEYFKLKSEMLLLRSLKEENEELRNLLNASQRLNERIALAELMQVNLGRDNHRISIGRGLTSGVYQGQAVIDDQGIIGQVIEVMPLSSVVILITDPGHAIPVHVERTGLRTIVYGTGDVTRLRVPYLNQNSDIQPGDQLLSSGLGGRFPKGYPVAVITDVRVVEDEAFIEVDAKPVAKLNHSNYVLLLWREAATAESNEEMGRG